MRTSIIDADVAAYRLAKWSTRARAMPRGAFVHAGQTHPLVVDSGRRIGYVVPGVGIALDADMKVLGISREGERKLRRAGVMGRSTIMRMLDTRGAVTSMLDARTAYATRKQQVSIQVVNNFQNGNCGELVDAVSSPFGATSALNKSSNGAWSLGLDNPSGGRTCYLAGVSTLCQTASTLGWAMAEIVDCLSQTGNMAISNNGVQQTVNTAALTRYTDGQGVYLAPIWQAGNGSATGGTGNTTNNFIYTNQGGTGSQSTTVAWGAAESWGIAVVCTGDASSGITNFPFFPLASGDWGVRSVEHFTWTQATTAANAGNFAVLLYHPLAFLHVIGENASREREMRSDPQMMVDLATEAGGSLGHISMFVNPNDGTTPTFNMLLDFMEG